MRKYFILILLFSICFVGYSQDPDSPLPWQKAYNISLENFQFTHPMTVVDVDELVIIKQRIKYAIEPQATAFIHLIKQAEIALNFIPNPPVTLKIPGGYVDAKGLAFARAVLWDNSYAAYTCALAYALTNHDKYAEKAVSILMSWANKGTTFIGEDRGLQLGSYFSSMLYTADLLFNYEGWLESDKTKFQTWWNQKCLLDGEVLQVMRKKDNNWKDAGLLGTLAASVILENHGYLKEALIQLKSYFYTRTDVNVRIPGDSWKISNDEIGVYLPREVVRNDGRSGLTYTAYALSSMVQCFEIARYAGYNFWNDTTEHGVGIVDVIKQYYRWDVGDEEFPWDSMANKSDKRRNLYELANTRFELNDDIKEFIRLNRPIAGREGDAYTTLNKGDMTGWDTTALAIPEIQKVERLSSTHLKVQWTVEKDNIYGFIIEREENSNFVVLDTLKSDCTSYLDTVLKTDTKYSYRIGVFNASENILYSSKRMEE
ncbi:MAG: alginate lyase family protein [Marinifilaceae bacterium]|nr:alginate lyase family protein [Marinifilaceae bacterium]